MSDTKHTPTPWYVDHLTIKADCNGIGIADVRGPDRRARGKEWQEDHDYCHGNAAFIVRAVNSHEQLVAALREAEAVIAEVCVDQHPDNTCCHVLRQVRAVLAAAEV